MKHKIISLILTTAVLCISTFPVSAFDYAEIDPDRVGNGWEKIDEKVNSASFDEMVDAICTTETCSNDDKALISFDKVFDCSESKQFNNDFYVDVVLGSKAVILEDVYEISVYNSEGYIAPDGYDESYAQEKAGGISKGATYTLDKSDYYVFEIHYSKDYNEDIFVNVTIHDETSSKDAFRSRYQEKLLAEYDAYLTGAEAVTDAPALTDTIMTTSKSQDVIFSELMGPLEAYNIFDNNYFKLRDICDNLSFIGYDIDVTWDGTNNAINLITGQPYTQVGGENKVGDGVTREANLSNAVVYLNGNPIDITAYNIEGNNFFKLRDLCRALNIYLEWDAQWQVIAVDPDRTYVEN